MQNAESFGKDLAEWLIDACDGHDFIFAKPFQDDWRWTVLAEASGEKSVITCAIRDKSIYVERADWLITIDKERRWKMFGLKDSALSSNLCDMIQNVLRDKPHILEIRWTDQIGHFAR